jgi:hypothetical protein
MNDKDLDGGYTSLQLGFISNNRIINKFLKFNLDLQL